MRIEEVNIYIESLLSLADLRPPEERSSDSELRAQLIEEAAESESFVDLLRSWLVVHDLDDDAVLPLKVWTSLNYIQLGKVMGRSPKEIAQILRTQRGLLLGSYPPVDRALETEELAGMSCFMVEQHLSAWTDAEVADSRIVSSLRSHLDQCGRCRNRLEAYRDLQKKILLKRRSYPALSEMEWNDALAKQSVRRKKLLRSVLLYTLALLIVVGIVVAFFWSRPERMPNVYEIP